MDASTVKDYFEKPEVVRAYAEAAENVGLWNSERAVFAKYIPQSAAVLELGCGAGRIAHGLARMGYTDITATDFSQKMVEAAAEIAQRNGYCGAFKVCDATKIRFPDGSFDAVIFGFNGLMQIPLRKNRRRALAEIFRVLRGGGVFIFTTHDRAAPANAEYWRAERLQWEHGCQNPVLDEFGDIFYRGDYGNIFIHSPSGDEIADDLALAGFELLFEAPRGKISSENASVQDFSDECVFRVVKKPQS